MAHDSSPNKTMAMNRGQGHTTFTEDQFNVLIKTFSLKSNPGYATEQTNSEALEARFGFRIEELGLEFRKIRLSSKSRPRSP